MYDNCEIKEYDYYMYIYALELGSCIINQNTDQKTCYNEYIQKLKELNDTILKIDAIQLNECKKT